MLADGLTYARQLGATHLIDAATLTGAISVALGKTTAGVFSNDEAVYGKFSEGLAVSGEKFWRMPLGDEYAELIKSDIGDIKNTGGRYGGAVVVGRVSARVCRGHSLDPSGYRQCGVDRGFAAVHRQRPERDRGAVDRGVGAELLATA